MSDDRPIPGDLSSGEDIINDIKPDIRQNINGYLVEVIMFEKAERITIDGKLYSGTFMDAIRECAKLPIRWNGIFD